MWFLGQNRLLLYQNEAQDLRNKILTTKTPQRPQKRSKKHFLLDFPFLPPVNSKSHLSIGFLYPLQMAGPHIASSGPALPPRAQQG